MYNTLLVAYVESSLPHLKLEIVGFPSRCAALQGNRVPSVLPATASRSCVISYSVESYSKYDGWLSNIWCSLLKYKLNCGGLLHLLVMNLQELVSVMLY